MIDFDLMPMISYREATRLLKEDGYEVNRNHVAMAAEVLRLGIANHPSNMNAKAISRVDFERLKIAFQHRKKTKGRRTKSA